MCRALSYIGERILLKELFYGPDNSLVTQSHNPKLMSHLLNLAGFGFSAWDRSSFRPDSPFLYRNHFLPFYDENLYHLAIKIHADCLIAHVRGVEYSEKNVVSNQNVHPFLFAESSIAFAHNGSLCGFQDMRFDLLKLIDNKYRKYIKGTTDSETMYALLLSQLHGKTDQLTVRDMFSALVETFKLLSRVRKKHHIRLSSPLNFFISNGNFIVGTRFVFDYGHYNQTVQSRAHLGYHSLWYTFGEKYGLNDDGYHMKTSDVTKSMILASEPLTSDPTTWIEVPEYSLIGASFKNGKLMIESCDLIV